MLAGYSHFARAARAGRWDEGTIDLRPDAEAWPLLSDGYRARVLTLVAGFGVAEAGVADALEPFPARTSDPEAARCFGLQAADERRHARFFDRVAGEVARMPGESPVERRRALRRLLDPRFLDLFERRLPETASRLAARSSSLQEAVGLYHLVLEGVVLAAGQTALLELLDRLGSLPGLREGTARVARDERWHIGFGARCLTDAAPGADALRWVLEEGERAAAAWGSAVPAAVASRAADLHRRRLRATALLPAAPAEAA
jgi:ribonucleoside-diphosphate reductase beta chain